MYVLTSWAYVPCISVQCDSSRLYTFSVILKNKFVYKKGLGNAHPAAYVSFLRVSVLLSVVKFV
jgi:hypothetical protein